MPAQRSEHIIRFGVFELDLRSGELRREGVRLPVQGRPVQTLAILLREPGQVVTREQLRTELWPADTFVDFEHGLHNAVARLRAVLGDTAGTPRFIETLPRRGYRFIGTVEPAVALPQPELPSAIERVAEAGAKIPVRKQYPWRGLAVAAILVFIAGALGVWYMSQARPGERIESLAVLPFENLSRDPEQEYFADGMTDALITDLANIKALRLVSRTSLMRYKGTRKSAPEIAGELHVQAVLEGAVERAGNRVRISVRLIRATTDQPVWAESYDRDLRDVLLLQDDVARSIARAIRIEVTPEERARLTNARQIDPEAYQLYLKGRYFWDKRTRESAHKALEYFDRAIQKDPGYAAAYSGLADCYSTLGFSFDMGELPPGEVRPKAMAAAERALALDPSVAEAHTSLAFVRLTYDWDFSGAEAEFQRGIALSPRSAYAHHWYSHLLIAAGRLAEAERESRRTLELDPVSPMLNTHMAWHYLYSKQYDRALEQLARVLELDPHFGLAYWYRGLAYEQKRAYVQALDEMRKAKELLPQNLVIDADTAHVYAVSGKRAEARQTLANLERLSAHTYVSAFGRALIYLGLQEKNRAMDLLDQAYRERSDMLGYLRIEPRLAPLHGEARFQELIRKVGIPQ